MKHLTNIFQQRFVRQQSFAHLSGCGGGTWYTPKKIHAVKIYTAYRVTIEERTAQHNTHQ